MVLIGAGSAVFTLGLVMDMIAEEWDEKWELCLVDIEKSVLESMAVLCSKILYEKKKEDLIKLTWSTDRKGLLPGADFVISTIAVGGRRAWEKDVFIPREYGIFQPVGDSVAPGGISRAMRMIPAVTAIAEDIKKFCPKAYFFSYSNPMTTICTAVRKETGVPVIGHCHGVQNGIKRLASLAKLPEEKCSAYVVGLNHFVILYKFYHEGKDAWPKVHESLKMQNADLGPLSTEFIKLYNAYPCSDDRHYVEFTQQYFGENAYFGKTLGIDAYSFERTIQNGDEKYTQTEELARLKGPLPMEFWRKIEGEHEELMSIIKSILNDHRQVFNINIPNKGSVASLPSNTVLEMPAIATAHGFIPLIIEDFPPIFNAILSKHIGIADLTVQAALEGNVRLFNEAIWQGGYMESRAKTTEMADKLLKAQAEYNTRF